MDLNGVPRLSSDQTEVSYLMEHLANKAAAALPYGWVWDGKCFFLADHRAVVAKFTDPTGRMNYALQVPELPAWKEVALFDELAEEVRKLDSEVPWAVWRDDPVSHRFIQSNGLVNQVVNSRDDWDMSLLKAHLTVRDRIGDDRAEGFKVPHCRMNVVDQSVYIVMHLCNQSQRAAEALCWYPFIREEADFSKALTAASSKEAPVLQASPGALMLVTEFRSLLASHQVKDQKEGKAPPKSQVDVVNKMLIAHCAAELLAIEMARKTQDLTPDLVEVRDYYSQWLATLGVSRQGFYHMGDFVNQRCGRVDVPRR